MTTMTISLPDQIARKIDEETIKAGFATRSEFIRNIVRQHFSDTDQREFTFEEFTPIPLSQLQRDMEQTGNYNKKFIDSVIRGFRESSLYAKKRSSFKTSKVSKRS